MGWGVRFAWVYTLTLCSSFDSYIFRRFHRVRWPSSFNSFVNSLDLLQVLGLDALVGRAVTPLHCITNIAFGYYDRLCYALLLPLLASALILAVAALTRLCTPSEMPWIQYFCSPTTFDVHIWLFLVVSVGRQLRTTPHPPVRVLTYTV